MTDEDRQKIEPSFNRALDIREKNPLEAIKILKELDEKHPNQPAIIGMIGGIYFGMNDYAQSLPYYEKVAHLSPKSELASLGLFHCLWRHERIDDAFEEARRFIKLNGYSEEYAFALEELDDSGLNY